MNEKLVRACESGDLDTVKELLKNGADPSCYNNYSIKIASCNGHTEIVELLLQDARVDPSNESIIRACIAGNVDVVKLLLDDSRVNPAEPFNDLIERASMFGHADVLEVLFQDGRLSLTERAIERAQRDEIKEILIRYKYRVDEPEYRKMKEANDTDVRKN